MLVHIITHPEVNIDPNVPVPLWGLSPKGRLRFEQMLHQGWVANVGAILCSTEQKAVDGAILLAQKLHLNFTALRGLDEVDRSATGYLPRAEHDACAEQLLRHPTQSVRGWERGIDAQARFATTLDDALSHIDPATNVAVVAHGFVALAYLAILQGKPINEMTEFAGEGGGYYFTFEQQSRRLLHSWQAIEDLG